ncbi:MAG: peptidoglycan DD-metalloendopeptidase family protein [Bacteroidetes bacterium]|nr:peptidoglycan DD-metalloendopeptidase family protein [Bacteroidota bacterium]
MKAIHKSDSLSNNIDKPTKKNDDTVAYNHKNLSYDELTFFIDSLLDLDTIRLNEIELVTYYSSLLKKETIRLEGIPAPDFYELFDEAAVFTITPENELLEEQLLVVTSDSLGSYFHPKEGIVTSKFGWRDKRMHKGIDINLNKGDAVKAAFNGMVRVARKQGGYGNVVIVRHYNGLETVYAHLSKIKVKPGDVVTAGQLIGLGGSTGHSSGPHLHFEVRFKGHPLNPANFISFTENKIEADSIIIKHNKYGVCAYPSNATLYSIQKGDSWFEIAKRYGMSTKQLCSLNGTDKRYYLRVGQKLRIN